MDRSFEGGTEWITKFERSGFMETAPYDESIEYFRRFTEATAHARMFPIAVSPQGRPVMCLAVAGDGEFSPRAARRSGKAIVLVQNAIHAGEVDGKDAWMLLLRDMLITRERADLLERAVILLIPILNPDGHERSSHFNRPNQNGPVSMGWRTTAQNCNMNRDYMKADSPEMRGLLRLIATWNPDLVIDNHATDGADFQYHVSYGLERHANMHPELAGFAIERFLPALKAGVESDGFLVSIYVQMRGSRLEDGIIDWGSNPRFSTGYAAARNRICLLVETHSLKPFAKRVFATLSMNVRALEIMNEQSSAIRTLNRRADADTIERHLDRGEPLPLRLAPEPDSVPMSFLGYRTYHEYSPVTGGDVLRYTDEPVEFTVPLYNFASPADFARVPFAYLIPRELSSIVRILHTHGIFTQVLRESHTMPVAVDRLNNVRLSPHSYEGRQRMECEPETQYRVETLEAGTYVVPTRQRCMKLIVHLLEPRGPDSFLAWGFFNAFVERKEYAEPYILEPIAREMLDNDPVLAEEFRKRLDSDERFRDDPGLRLDFFYRRSLYYDQRENIYPIFRLTRQTDLKIL